jgi:hypothetical protein
MTVAKFITVFDEAHFFSQSTQPTCSDMLAFGRATRIRRISSPTKKIEKDIKTQFED